MKVCFDTNVVLDIFDRAEKFPDSLFAYDVAHLREFDTVIPVSIVTDIFYILNKRKKGRRETNECLKSIFNLFDLYGVTPSDCMNALESPLPDLEDAFLVESAKRVSADCIITRDKKDFKKSSIPVMTPQEFFKHYCPPDYSYDLVSL